MYFVPYHPLITQLLVLSRRCLFRIVSFVFRSVSRRFDSIVCISFRFTYSIRFDSIQLFSRGVTRIWSDIRSVSSADDCNNRTNVCSLFRIITHHLGSRSRIEICPFAPLIIVIVRMKYVLRSVSIIIVDYVDNIPIRSLYLPLNCTCSRQFGVVK